MSALATRSSAAGSACIRVGAGKREMSGIWNGSVSFFSWTSASKQT